MSSTRMTRRSTRISHIPTPDVTTRKSRRVVNKPIILSDSDEDFQVPLNLQMTPPKQQIRVSAAPLTPSFTLANLSLVSPLKKKRTAPCKPVIESDDDDCYIVSYEPGSPNTPRKKQTSDQENEKMGTPPKQRKIGAPASTEKKEKEPSLKQENSDQENIKLATPSKQRKISPVAPPSTPSSLLKNLSLTEEKGSKLKLFSDENDVFINAKRALHSTYPTSMPGRQKELEELEGFIVKHLNEGTSGTLYVSGPPGTGKTASLNLILQDEKISSELKYVYVNCTAIKSSGSIFSRIAKDLGIRSRNTNEKEYVNDIEGYLNKKHKTILLVLDEIDQLESKKQSVLYTIFEWPANPNSKLILIGIANALDLTDRILPRLQARCELKPELMHFSPYSKQQIVEIFTARLKTAGVLDVFTPIAIQMLAGKVAAVSGDLRRALDIGRRVIELVGRKERNGTVLHSVENIATELGIGDVPKSRTVELGEVVKVLNNVYGASQNLDDDIDDAFPLQQKIVVCSLVLILKKAKNKDVTIGRLHDVYRKVCAKRNIQIVDQGEFVGVCYLIETKGIIRVLKKKDPRLSKISLVWDEDEVGAALRDKELMSMILQDDSCLGKL